MKQPKTKGKRTKLYETRQLYKRRVPKEIHAKLIELINEEIIKFEND